MASARGKNMLTRIDALKGEEAKLRECRLCCSEVDSLRVTLSTTQRELQALKDQRTAVAGPLPVVTPVAPRAPEYVGCFTDNDSRTMIWADGDARKHLDACQRLAETKGMRYFALQDTGTNGDGQCFVSNDLSQAQRLGAASNCVSINGRMQGSAWSNAIYDRGASPAPLPALPLVAPTATASRAPEYVGCFTDNDRRTMIWADGNAWADLDTCQKLAAAKGMRYFATQATDPKGVGACFLSNDLDQARSLGGASNCINIQGRMQGHAWSNAIYDRGAP